MPITPEQEKIADEKAKEMLQKMKDQNLIKIKVDDNEAYSHLQDEFRKVKAEKDDLEAKLTLVAEQEFSRRKNDVEIQAKQLGLDVTLETPEDLRATEKIIRENTKTNTGNRDIPLNARQLNLKPENENEDVDPFEISKTKPIMDVDFEDREQLISTLTKISGTENHPRKAEADKILGKMYQRLDTRSITLSREKEGGLPKSDHKEWEKIHEKVKELQEKRGIR